MLEHIKQIGINPSLVNAAGDFGKKAKSEEKEEKEKPVQGMVEGGPAKVSVDDVLNFMAQSAVSVTPAKAKVIDPAKYIDKESELRIADLMAGFEDKVAEGLEKFAKEFPQMSEGAKMAAVLTGINNEA